MDPPSSIPRVRCALPSLVLAAALFAAAAPGAAAQDRLTVDRGEGRDAHGRAVMFRGVNFPWGLRVPGVADGPPVPADADAAQIRRLGFNLARVQLSWKAIEPGTAGPNDPAICAPGPPGDPRQWNDNHAQAYLDRVEAVVAT